MNFEIKTLEPDVAYVTSGSFLVVSLYSYTLLFRC